MFIVFPLDIVYVNFVLAILLEDDRLLVGRGRLRTSLEEEALVGVRLELAVAGHLLGTEDRDNLMRRSREPCLGAHDETVDVHPDRLLGLSSQTSPHRDNLLDRLLTDLLLFLDGRYVEGQQVFVVVVHHLLDVEDLHPSTSHASGYTPDEHSVCLFAFPVVIEQIVDEFPVVASLGTFTVALGLVAGTSCRITGHLAG